MDEQDVIVRYLLCRDAWRENHSRRRHYGRRRRRRDQGFPVVFYLLSLLFSLTYGGYGAVGSVLRVLRYLFLALAKHKVMFKHERLALLS